MSTRVGTSGVSHEDLVLHFDGELTGAEAHELAGQIEADPELREELAQLGVLRGLVSETLLAKAEEVPQARFEQIWGEIDRTLDRDAREAAASQPSTASIWSRMWAAIKPVRVPLAVAGAAAAVALVFANMGPDSQPSGTNNPEAIASSQEPAAEQPTPESDQVKPPAATPAPNPGLAPDPGRLAQADPEPADDMPKPKKVEAEIHGVDFSGHTGRISRTGTVTVLYLEEEMEPKDSERSL